VNIDAGHQTNAEPWDTDRVLGSPQGYALFISIVYTTDRKYTKVVFPEARIYVVDIASIVKKDICPTGDKETEVENS
jgi:hypothetical protein